MGTTRLQLVFTVAEKFAASINVDANFAVVDAILPDVTVERFTELAVKSHITDYMTVHGVLTVINTLQNPMKYW